MLGFIEFKGESALSQKSEDAAKKVLIDAQERVKISAEDCAQKISDRIKRFVEQNDENLKTYESSPFVQQVQTNILNNFNVNGANEFVQGGTAVLGTGGAMAGAMIAKQGAQVAAQFAKVGITPLGHAVGNAVGFGTGVVAEGILAGTDGAIFSGLIGKGVGELVKNIPIFKAEPIMIKRIAQAFTGNGSKIFGAAMAAVTAVLSLVLLWREGKKAEERERMLRQKRNEIMSGFNDLADDIGRDILNSVHTFMTQNVAPIISAFDEKIKAVETLNSNDKIKSEKLSALLKRTENLIAKIQAEEKPTRLEKNMMLD